MMRKLLTFIFAMSLLSTYAQDKPTAFKVGDTAPDLLGKDHSGKMVSLTELIKKGKVVVMFYHGAWCVFCNKYMSQMKAALPEFSANYNCYCHNARIE